VLPYVRLRLDLAQATLAETRWVEDACGGDRPAEGRRDRGQSA